MAAAGGDGQNQQQTVGLFNWRFLLIIGLTWYFFFNRAPAPGGTTDSQGKTLPPHSIIYPPGTYMDLYVYLVEDAQMDWNSAKLLWRQPGFELGSWAAGNSFKKSITIPATPTIQNNGSVYAHIFFNRPGKTPEPKAKNYAKSLFSSVHQLNKYIRKNLATLERKNLISGELDKAWIERQEYEQRHDLRPADKWVTLSHWKGNLTISVINDNFVFARGTIPPQLLKYFSFDAVGNFYPVVFGNDFWLLNEDLMQINDTVSELNLDMAFEPIGLFKWTMMTQMEESFSMQKTMFGAEEGEIEDFKRILTDNNPYILLMTFAISIVHMVLDTLAFKNDIQFWRNKKSMAGMSVRTIYVNTVCNLIIFVYLLDNDTSMMILVSAGLGLAIELWKVTRAVNVTIGWRGSIPYPILTDKNSYANKTKEFDLAAMKYLNYALYPLVVLYAIYSLLYENHKSWYSWILSTLAGCVYTFGFIMMTPQLFINYKLQSVAHLPWRVFVYKAISTFIDDLFAFLIRMPTLHRLRVFRDDIVFLIYLYQRWIYRVDKNRIETGAEFEDASTADIQAAKAEAEAAQRASSSSSSSSDAATEAHDKAD